MPVVHQIKEHQESASQPIMVGINGCQGSGKSTLAAYLAMQLQHECNLTCAVISLDDFYLSQSQRKQLAAQVHPLLATRGVPGTHDTQLMRLTLNALKAQQAPPIPRFNKATDNPYPQSHWPLVSNRIDVILMEGWCWGTPPQEVAALKAPVNSLEQQEDSEGRWRQFVNEQLSNEYQAIFQLADLKLMLKAPSFDCVMRWRLEQEQKLAARLNAEDETSGVMSEQQVQRFISYFQRLTEHSLQAQPQLSDVIWQLDSNRKISNMEQPKEQMA